MPRAKLKPEVKTVFHFVIHSALPQHKQSKVYYKCLLLLYCIMTNRQIDVGKNIFDHAWEVSKSLSLGLPYPSLIFRLCESIGVIGYSALPITKFNKPINFTNISQFFQQTGREAPHCPALGGSPRVIHQQRPVSEAVPSRVYAQSEWRSNRNEDRRAKKKPKKERLSIAKTLIKVVKYCKMPGKQVVSLRKEVRELRLELRPESDVPRVEATLFDDELQSDETDTDVDIRNIGG